MKQAREFQDFARDFIDLAFEKHLVFFEAYYLLGEFVGAWHCCRLFAAKAQKQKIG